MEWYEGLNLILNSPAYKNMQDYISKRQQVTIVYPNLSEIFKAYELTPFEKVNVVIIGQDPYFNGNADGLAFSCKHTLSPSLRKIFERIQNELYINYDFLNINLSRWAAQGILLLNTTLTVEKNAPGSHINIGWKQLTGVSITMVARHRTNVVFCLWGDHAKQYKQLIEPFVVKNNHLILEAEHPAAASYNNREWYNNNCFSTINSRHQTYGKPAINW